MHDALIMNPLAEEGHRFCTQIRDSGLVEMIKTAWTINSRRDDGDVCQCVNNLPAESRGMLRERVESALGIPREFTGLRKRGPLITS
jgi:hypothetical protein